MAPKHTIDRSTISSPKVTVQTAYNAKFQLPAIDIPQAPLTEGTDIPPPKPSPPPSPPQTPLSATSPNPLRSHPTSSHSLNHQFLSDAKSRNGYSSPPVASNGATRSQRDNTVSSATKMPPPSAGSITTAQSQYPTSANKRSFSAQTNVSSPPTKKRQSIRKLLSLKSLTSRSSLDVSTKSSMNQEWRDQQAAALKRSESPAPSAMTGMTTTTVGTENTLRKRRSGAFWRKRDSFFGLGSVGEDTIMGGTGEAERDEYEREQERQRMLEEEKRRNRTPPPTLPEIESIGEGVRMDYGSAATDPAEESHAPENKLKSKKRPSGWFGGAGMFEGIS